VYLFGVTVPGNERQSEKDPLLPKTACREAGSCGWRRRIRRTYVKAAEVELNSAQAKLDAIDAEIFRVERRLNPADISAIRAHKFYAGSRRGTLKKAIATIIQSAWPGVVDTSQMPTRLRRTRLDSAGTRCTFAKNSGTKPHSVTQKRNDKLLKGAGFRFLKGCLLVYKNCMAVF